MFFTDQPLYLVVFGVKMQIMAFFGVSRKLSLSPSAKPAGRRESATG
jgi:hypothetical protein